jgi:hypothetical protein
VTTGMLAGLRLLKMELVILALAVGVLIMFVGGTAVQLLTLNVIPCLDPRTAPQTCLEQIRAFADLTARVLPLEIAVSVVCGFGAIVIGVGLGTRDIERGHGYLIWPLAGRRRDWFGPRMVVMGAILTIALFVMVVPIHLLESVAWPSVNPFGSLLNYELRFPVVIARTLAALGLGVLIGSLIGRSLPAILVSVVVVLGLVATVGAASDALERARAEIIDVPTTASPFEDDLADVLLETRYRDRAGRVLTAAEVSELVDVSADDFTLVYVGARGSDWVLFAGITSGMFLAAGLTAGLAAIVVLERRGPT